MRCKEMLPFHFEIEITNSKYVITCLYSKIINYIKTRQKSEYKNQKNYK